MIDKMTFTVAYFGLFVPLRLVSFVLNRMSLYIFMIGAYFISPWATLVITEVSRGKGQESKE